MAGGTFKVAGTSYRESAIRSLATLNDDYNMRNSEILEYYSEGDEIFKYDFPDDLSVNLVDEPDNQYDPDAIRVELNGVTVGYIKKGSTSRVRNLRADPEMRVRAEIFPGPCKKVLEDDDGKLHVEKHDMNFGIKLVFATELDMELEEMDRKMASDWSVTGYTVQQTPTFATETPADKKGGFRHAVLNFLAYCGFLLVIGGIAALLWKDVSMLSNIFLLGIFLFLWAHRKGNKKNSK